MVLLCLLEIPFGYCKGHPNLLSQIAIHLNLDFLQEHTQTQGSNVNISNREKNGLEKRFAFRDAIIAYHHFSTNPKFAKHNLLALQT